MNSAAFTPSSFCANSLPDLVFVLTEVKLQSGYELEFLLCRGEKRDGALYPLRGGAERGAPDSWASLVSGSNRGDLRHD
jgi:hypothetical protein